MVILVEGTPTHLWCPLCDMLVPWKALNGTYMRTAKCTRVAEWKILRLAAE